MRPVMTGRCFRALRNEPRASPGSFPFGGTGSIGPADPIQLTYLSYCTAEVFIDVFIASVFSAALSCVTVPDMSSFPIDSAGVQ